VKNSSGAAGEGFGRWRGAPALAAAALSGALFLGWLFPPAPAARADCSAEPQEAAAPPRSASDIPGVYRCGDKTLYTEVIVSLDGGSARVQATSTAPGRKFCSFFGEAALSEVQYSLAAGAPAAFRDAKAGRPGRPRGVMLLRFSQNGAVLENFGSEGDYANYPTHYCGRGAWFMSGTHLARGEKSQAK
jgi:hypothetical protein